MNTILFQSANVLDVTSLQIKSGQDVWVENGLIKSVVPHQPDVFIASGTKVVKAQGKTLMPGLIDCHFARLAHHEGHAHARLHHGARCRRWRLEFG
jgi:imidazolonepropionase-like amidohydrolase